MNFSKLDSYLETLKHTGIPACELIITHKGDTVYHKCAGFSNADGTTPTSENDIYWLYSATKVITCIAAMRLVERGIISLDDPVSKYIPEYESLLIHEADGSSHKAKETLRVWHLFTMTGGMTYEKATKNIIEARDRSTVGIVRAMARDGLVFEPGTHFKYSLCHDVLAAIVEIASGVRYSEYLKRNIFEPLGIVDMGFKPSAEQNSRFSAMYKHHGGTAKAELKKTENSFVLSEEFESGGAGLFGTASEYIKIITALSLGGTARNGYQLLTEESVRMMQKNYLCDAALDDFSATSKFGYGWGLCGRVHIAPVVSCSASPVGEFGWDGAAGAYVLIDPENELAIFYVQHVMSCSYVYHTVHPRLRNMAYEAIMGE